MSTSTPNEADAASAAAGDTTDASESSCDVLGGTTGNDRKRRRCEICVESIAKYRCPACGVQTCSVPCVRQHKADTGCTGKPDLTTYVPLSSFDENLLLQGMLQMMIQRGGRQQSAWHQRRWRCEQTTASSRKSSATRNAAASRASARAPSASVQHREVCPRMQLTARRHRSRKMERQQRQRNSNRQMAMLMRLLREAEDADAAVEAGAVEVARASQRPSGT